MGFSFVSYGSVKILTSIFVQCGSFLPVIYKAKFTDSNFLHNYDDEVVIILLL